MKKLLITATLLLLLALKPLFAQVEDGVDICKALSEAGKITRSHRNAAWQLTDAGS
jgi:hypothetical protein